MDWSSFAVSLGESTAQVFVEQLTQTGHVTVVQAWLRPCTSPFTQRTDVTNAFMQLLGEQMVLTDTPIDPKTLVQKERALLENTSRRKWYWPFAHGKKGRRASIDENEAQWLLVSFSKPGGAFYIACYRVPMETVTFPPINLSRTELVPISKNIMRCAVVVRENQSDDEEITIIDFTDTARAMAGPCGDFFERPDIDLRLACAESQVDAMLLLRHALARDHFSVVLETADGTTHCIDLDTPFAWD